MTTSMLPADAVPVYAVVVVYTELSQRGLHAEQVDDDLTPEDPNARTWHYRVPPAMQVPRPGHLVWVPFGKRYLQGLVVALDDHSPVSEDATRDLDQIVDPEPILSPAHLDLARWISVYYMTPLYRVIQSMLPPGITQTTETLIALNPEADVSGLSKIKTQIVALLQAQGPLVERQIGRLSGLSTWQEHMRNLVKLGVLTSQMRIRPPAVRPKLEPVVRLAMEAPLSSLSASATRQLEVVAYLQRRSRTRRWVPVGEVVAQTGATSETVRTLCDKGLLERSEIQVWRDPLAGQAFVPVVPPELTPSQCQVWEVIAADLDAPAGKPFLLQGVTGSGKTEIYLRAVERVLEQGRGAIILVPEIALTPQTIRRFGARFPETIAVMHSGLTPGERYDQWHRIRAGELRLVVGARSAVFSPVRHLSLIVLDEEHEWTYKQDDVAPHYHTRDVAVRLASLCGATCILGSATPALESAYLAERGAYMPLHMPERVMGHRRVVEQQARALHHGSERYQAEIAGTDLDSQSDAMYTDLPPVEVVDMRTELRAGNTSILSRSLSESLTAVLGAGEQAILFLNRRGSATFVMCRDCGHVLSCPRCDMPLTYHGVAQKLICHHCNTRYDAPSICPNCYSKRIRYFGAGTQRVEEVVREAYPQARVVRWDTDTVEDARSHQAFLDQFIRGEADVMVGTQMVAKGLDLPRVTLVGVISADTILHLPDFRSSERTFQVLTQVAGRAGRSVLGGKVIIQTYTPEHPAIRAASHHDYGAFYREEIAFRRQHWYPPLSQMIRLVYVNASAARADEEAHALHALLTERIARLGLADLDLIGPAPAFFGRIKGKTYWHILVRGVQPQVLLQGLALPLGWRVDVDPISVL